MSTNKADILYGTKAIAEYMNITPRQAEHQIQKGGLPAWKQGGVICARKSSINAWIEESERKARNSEPARTAGAVPAMA